MLGRAQEGPLADALVGHETCTGERLQVRRGGRLGNAELPRDEDDADAVLHEVAVLLRRKVRARILEPAQDQQALLVGQGLDDVDG